MTRDKSAAGSLLATLLSGVVDLLPALGLNAQTVLSRAGLTREYLCGPEGARVPARAEHRLWQAIEAEARDCTVGLRLAELYLKAGMPSLEGYLARNAPTLRAVLVDMDRFAAISDDRLRMVLLERDDGATIRMLRAPDRAQGYVECQFAIMVGFVHQYIGPIPLWSVDLRRPKPRKIAPFRAAFAGVVPAFGRSYNQMYFPRSALDAPVRGAEPALARILESHAKSLVERVPGGDPFISRVRHAVEQGLHEGRVGLERVAARVALSERTLRRQLLARQTSYKALADEVRCEFACKLLTDNESVPAVAERVGFRSTSAFQKAFARWMKVSPSQYRRMRAG